VKTNRERKEEDILTRLGLGDGASGEVGGPASGFRVDGRSVGLLGGGGDERSEESRESDHVED